MELIPVELTHKSGPKFKVYLTNYEIQRVANDENFLEEISEKYYKLYKNNLICASSDNCEYHLSMTETDTLLNHGEQFTDEDRSVNDCGPGPSHNKENQLNRWTNESVMLLLDLRLAKEEEFNKPTCKKNKLWVQIAKDMNLIGKYTVTGDDCYSKYRNLLQTYRQNKEKRLKKSGESKITWEFFEIMDNVLGNKAASVPPAETLSSSINADHDFSNESDNIEEEPLEPPAKKSKNKQLQSTEKNKKSDTKKELSLQQYLFLKNEKDSEKWNEKKILREKEIDALNNLADAIRSSVNSK